MTPERTLTLADIEPQTSLGMAVPSGIESRTSLRTVGQQVSILAHASLAAAAVASAALGMIVGTGGSATAAAFAQVRSGISPNLRWGYQGGSDRHDEEDDLVFKVSERLAQIRHYLSLNATELAQILRVERPTVYAWLSDRAWPQAANLQRLVRIHKLARSWRAISSRPLGTLVREPIDAGQSLVDLMSEEHLDEGEIRRRLFPDFKRRIDQEQEARRGRRRGIAEAAQRHGFPELPRRVRQRAFDDETSL